VLWLVSHNSLGRVPQSQTDSVYHACGLYRNWWSREPYTISRCAKNSKIIGYGRWPNMSHVVNNISSAVKMSRKIFGIDWLCLGFATNTKRMKKENTDNLYYIKFHTQKFVHRSWPDLIRHRDIVYCLPCLWSVQELVVERSLCVQTSSRCDCHSTTPCSITTWISTPRCQALPFARPWLLRDELISETSTCSTGCSYSSSHVWRMM